MYTLSLDVPSVQRRAERENDDTINDPLSILIAAEEELEFDEPIELGSCTKCHVQFDLNDWVWDGRCLACM